MLNYVPTTHSLGDKILIPDIPIPCSFLYKLFRAKRNRRLKRLTWVAHDIWNYVLGWQRTCYALGLPYMSYTEMSRQLTILRKAHPEVFADWRELDSWAARQVWVPCYVNNTGG